MVTTYYNPADIEYACAMIRRKGEEPILYTSVENAAKLFPFTVEVNTKIPSHKFEEINESGMIGYYYGCIVYITDAVGDLWVIVPRCKENLNNGKEE